MDDGQGLAAGGTGIDPEIGNIDSLGNGRAPDGGFGDGGKPGKHGNPRGYFTRGDGRGGPRNPKFVYPGGGNGDGDDGMGGESCLDYCNAPSAWVCDGDTDSPHFHDALLRGSLDDDDD